MGNRGNIIVLDASDVDALDFAVLRDFMSADHRLSETQRASAILALANRAAVVLYSHWGGTDLPYLLQEVIKRKLRWDDAAYLARIIFSRMVAGDVAGETGFGISSRLCDNEHPVLIVDVSRKVIVSLTEGEYTERGAMAAREFCGISFETFSETSEQEMEKLHDASRLPVFARRRRRPARTR